jgi:hypothetical protein
MRSLARRDLPMDDGGHGRCHECCLFESSKRRINHSLVNKDANICREGNVPDVPTYMMRCALQGCRTSDVVAHLSFVLVFNKPAGIHQPVKSGNPVHASAQIKKSQNDGPGEMVMPRDELIVPHVPITLT